MSRFSIFLFLLALFAATVVGSIFIRKESLNITEISNIDQKPLEQTPTEVLFKELTIPYLREREYASVLGEKTIYKKFSNYTSYLTSYDSDGLKINGLLTIPNGEVPQEGWPAIVFVHGYIPPTIYRTTNSYIDHVDYLSRNGFVVFKIDLRGHDKSEGLAEGGYYSGSYVIDVLNARAALQSSDFVGNNNIGLWGHSMAGNVIFRAFTAKTEIPAIVIWAGAVYSYKDMQEYGIDDNSYRPPVDNTERMKKRQALRDAHGDFSEESEFWKLVAPTNYISDLKGAVQIHHSVDDSVVSIEYSRNLNKLLDESSIDHELYEYSSGGHNITGSSFSTAMQRAVDFFREKLK